MNNWLGSDIFNKRSPGRSAMNTQVNDSATLATRKEWLHVLQENVVAEIEPNYRRKHRRYSVFGEVKATGIVDDAPFKRTWTLTEISAEGITAKSDNEIPVGIRLELAVNITGTPLFLRGQVTHCTQTVGGYKVGIWLDLPPQ
jgi:hypothetical protein